MKVRTGIDPAKKNNFKQGWISMSFSFKSSKRIVKLKFWLIGIMFFFILPVYSWADTYFVGQKGAGTQTGDSYSNRMSVDKHNQSDFVAGNVIYLVGKITSQVCPPSDGNSSSRITYRGDYTGQKALLTSGSSSRIRLDGRRHIEIQNIEIANTDFGIASSGTAYDIVITNCLIHDLEYKGILFQRRSDIYKAPVPQITTGISQLVEQKIKEMKFIIAVRILEEMIYH